MVAKSCIICKATKEEGAKLFDAPKDVPRRNAWSASCGITIKKSSSVCQKHFTDLDFSCQGRISKLKFSAVPSKVREDTDVRNINTKIPTNLDIKEEPEFVPVSETNTEAVCHVLSADVSVNVKEEPIECRSLSLVIEECFDVSPDDPLKTLEIGKRTALSSTKSLTCGRIVMEMGNDNVKKFRLICDHCQNSFDTTNTDFWTSFLKHINEAHLPEPPVNVNVIGITADKMLINTSKKNEEVEDTAKENGNKEYLKEINNTQIETDLKENENISIDDGDDYDNLQDFDSSENDETFEPKAKKRKKSKTNADNSKQKISTQKQDILSIDHPDRKCVITFLELLTTRAILWLPRQSIMKRFDEALMELTNKFNELFPKYTTTKDTLRYSINRIKDFYHRTLDADQKKQRRSKTSLSKRDFPEYFELCAEIEENSKNILKTCDICKTTFYSPQDLQVHMYKKHGIGELPYKCPRCSYGFSCPEKLANHEAKHNRSKSFKCEICGQGFYFKCKLEAHMTLHTDDSKQVCETCGKKFPSLSKYRRHKLHHEPPKEKCEICGKLYFEKWTLSEHMKSHRNERQYKCDICGKTFNRQEGVTIHKRGVHKIKTQTKKYVWVNRVTNTMPPSTSDIQNSHSNSSSFLSTANEETMSPDVKPIIPNNNTNQQQMFPLEILHSLLN